MNKNLETEYQNMIRAEVPDIWDKIEAKIDAQEAQKKVVAFKKKPTRWKYYVIPAAAALLCVAIAIPVLLNRGAMGGTAATAPASNSTSTGSGMYFAADTMTEAPCEAAAEEPEAYYENTMETDNKTKDSVASYSFDMRGSDSTQGAALTGGDSLQIDPAWAVQEAEAEYSDDSEDEAQEMQLVLIVSVDKSMARIEREDLAESLDFDITEDEDEENSYIFISRRPCGTKEMIDITSYLMEYKGITGVRIDDDGVR